MNGFAQCPWRPDRPRPVRRLLDVVRSGSSASLLVASMVVVAWMSLPCPAFAAWPPFGRAVCAQDSFQGYQAITTDGADGAIITWQDSRFPVNIFAEHVRASGDVDPTWPVNGRALLTDAAALANAEGPQEGPQIVSDGAGGAIVAWYDQRRAETGGSGIFAQHVRSDGVVDPMWPPNGTGVRVIDGAASNPIVTSDGAGGAIIVWRDDGPSSNQPDIYAQHVMANGVLDAR